MKPDEQKIKVVFPESRAFVFHSIGDDGSYEYMTIYGIEDMMFVSANDTDIKKRDFPNNIARLYDEYASGADQDKYHDAINNSGIAAEYEPIGMETNQFGNPIIMEQLVSHKDLALYTVMRCYEIDTVKIARASEYDNQDPSDIAEALLESGEHLE